MRKEIKRQLSNDERKELLRELERIGAENIRKDLESTLLWESPDLQDETKQKLHELINDKEFLLRYFLLAAVLDQQAESETARKTARKLFEQYGYEFFMKPENYFDKIYEVIGFALKIYEPKTRVIRISKEGITFFRIGGFMLTVHNISNKYGGLYRYFSSKYDNPRALLNEGILGDSLLSGLLYEKAARLYVGWITHPMLYVKIFGDDERIRSSIPMVVNGHVTKVLARTGFLDKVSVEKERNIVKAEEERKRIEELVRTFGEDRDPFLIDYGAFWVGINYCKEENPNCDQCPLKNICKKNTEFRAY
jgi:Iron-sulfur binding domain of endonuclease III.